MKRPFFAVLGGMGTLATESFIRLVNKATKAQSDQDFLDYVVFNDASVPDRTAFINEQSKENPFPVIADDIVKATAMGASFIVLTCNTAHYFFDDFQALTPVPILHMPRLAIAELTARHPKQTCSHIGFLGTEGSLQAGVYRRAITAAGYHYIEPDAALQSRVTSLIYEDVKGGRGLDLQRYQSVLTEMLHPDRENSCDALILGCTELSVLNETFPLPEIPLIDAQEVLVKETVKRAQQLRVSVA
ncbi:aspartate/glutamate racemase family protein [Varibaculum vaginae]|uniref:aspartate/glutamate racemase family protein n=1 Tax=Varibaculum vaginae TaxID=2364797 RepID=UPI000F0806ED|nr:amino acid racemase [Varibaculum vaginae]